MPDGTGLLGKEIRIRVSIFCLLGGHVTFFRENALNESI